MKSYKSKFQITVLGKLFWVILLLSACIEHTNESGFIMNVPVNVEAFGIQGHDATIDHKTGQISLTLPYNTSITAVVPTVRLPQGAKVSPSLETPRDYSSPLEIRIVNGNLYSKYMINVKVNPPIHKFSVMGVNGSIDYAQRKISLTLPADADVSALNPEIELSEGVSISPSSGTTQDFSKPFEYTVSSGGHVVTFTVTVDLQATGVKVAYLGLAPNRNEINDPDEKEAGNWLFSNFSDVEYISFRDIANGKNLAAYSVIWWHYDEEIDLPGIALESGVVNALKNFRAAGGSLLLTTFASKYVEALGVVPIGKGPNNIFGDFLTNGFVDGDNSWGISFMGHQGHPIFRGLQTFQDGKAYLLEKGTFRQNHTAWWFLPEWGGYGDGAGWRGLTGGTNLASEAWDNELNGRVLIAEFPGNAQEGNLVVISAGAYDWYQENLPDGGPSPSNGYRSNIEKLTENTIKYLSE